MCAYLEVQAGNEQSAVRPGPTSSLLLNAAFKRHGFPLLSSIPPSTLQGRREYAAVAQNTTLRRAQLHPPVRSANSKPYIPSHPSRPLHAARLQQQASARQQERERATPLQNMRRAKHTVTQLLRLYDSPFQIRASSASSSTPAITAKTFSASSSTLQPAARSVRVL